MTQKLIQYQCKLDTENFVRQNMHQQVALPYSYSKVSIFLASMNVKFPISSSL